MKLKLKLKLKFFKIFAFLKILKIKNLKNLLYFTLFYQSARNMFYITPLYETNSNQAHNIRVDILLYKNLFIYCKITFKTTGRYIYKDNV